MREIKFRAKAIVNFVTHLDGIVIGDWVYGYYYFDRADMCGVMVTELQEECGGVGSGITQCHIKVDYKTVGQYTGLKDKNGKEIYKGDILEYYKELHIIHWDEHVAGFSWKNCSMNNYLMFRKFIAENCIVVGNQFENPEIKEV